MYGATIIVLRSLVKEGATNKIYGEAGGCLMSMKSFDFTFILRLMHKIMGISDMLCQTLQQKSLDILNAMNLVSMTKELLRTLQEKGFDHLLGHVKSICLKFAIDIPDMSTRYKEATGRYCQQNDDITVQHHYCIDIFKATVDYILDELRIGFNEESMGLLMLSSALDPRDNFNAFDPGRILLLAEKFYPVDFSGQDIYLSKCQLDHYRLDVVCHKKFQNMLTISELCRGLVETNKAGSYNLIDRLIRLILTLPVSTATTERAFSAMKFIKSDLRNKMENEYLNDSLVVFIEREIAETIDTNSIIDTFASSKDRKVLFS
ncbi:uncharacterized protein LOC120007343 [Tripterygium wilfordii]|uniref:uncharacterized protein LOC120007343 n=1 Tax=Tripterygium wilfordii TaxID=458696 RepID=UPI0018F808C5|nr:uncharacterized protein LOC120007343 [Tripterygium wilfordii]